MAVPHTGTPTTAVLSDAGVDDLTANTIVTPNLTATTAKIVTARFGGEPWFDVKAPAYAAVGDGVNDDTAEIQAAIDAAEAVGGGTVYFPDGDYKISSPLLLHSGVTLKGNGIRNSNISVAVTNVNGIEARGASSASRIVQCHIEDLKITGPGEAAGGTGVGVYVKWASVHVSIERCWIVNWGSHGASFEDSYSFALRDCLLDSNGGNGFHGITNINHATFDHCISIGNTGKGYYVEGGTTTSFLNSDAESNGGIGIDLRYVFAPNLLGCHLENNGTANIYLHYRSGLSEKTTAGIVQGCLIQGSASTPYGLDIDGASGVEVRDNWFSGNVTGHIRITANATHTFIGPNIFVAGTPLTDASSSTSRMERDTTNLMTRVAPGLLFDPRSANPSVLADGEVWYLDSTDKLHLRANGQTRTLIAGLQGSATLDFGSIAAGAVAILFITVAGAAAGDAVALGPPTGLTAGLMATGLVNSADTVTVRLHNTTGSAIDPASATWNATVFK